MSDAVAMKVLYSCDYLLKINAGLVLSESGLFYDLLLLFYDLFEQLTLLQKFSDKQYTFLGLNDFIELHYVAMSDCFKNIDLVFNTDDVFESHAFFVDQFHSYFFTCREMHG